MAIYIYIYIYRRELVQDGGVDIVRDAVLEVAALREDGLVSIYIYIYI